MKNIFLICAAAIFAIMPVVSFSVDVSGEWVVEQVDQKGMVAKTVLEFILEGSKLTGSMLGYSGDEWPILDGKVSGDKISFTIKQSAGNRTITNLYVGKIMGDTIEFSLTPINAGLGIPPRYKFTAKRIAQ